MFALLISAIVAAAPVTVKVEVLEYPTRKPLGGARVLFREANDDAGPPLEATVTTAEKGRGRGELAHLDFQLVEATKPGYLTDAELAPFRDLIPMRELVKRERHGDDELYYLVWLVPSSWLDGKIKVRTEAEASKIASEWGRECKDPNPSRIQLGHRSWTFIYSCMRVDVGMLDGAAHAYVPEVVSNEPLSPPEELLADAMGSPLKHVATDADGVNIPRCLYRNDEVIVVNDYCTIREIRTTGILIYHPRKGVAQLYAEAKEPISTIGREDYTQWRFEARDPFPGLDLTEDFQRLDRYDSRRRKLAPGGCTAGMFLGNDKNAMCWLKTPEIGAWWESHYRPMLREPPREWFALVKELRNRAKKDARPDPRSERERAAGEGSRR